MKMKYLLFLALMYMTVIDVYAGNSQLYARLDSVVADRANYTKEKEQRIEQIKAHWIFSVGES